MAKNKQAFQSSIRIGTSHQNDINYANKAIDDIISVVHPSKGVFQCNANSRYDKSTWFSVDLGKIYLVKRIKVLNRQTPSRGEL